MLAGSILPLEILRVLLHNALITAEVARLSATSPGGADQKFMAPSYQYLIKDLFTAVTIISCPLRELGATQASAVNPVAQLHVRTADEPQLSTKLADSETIKTMLDVKDWQGDSKLSGRWHPMKYIDVSVFGMVWWSQLCVGRASGFCGGSAPEGLPPRVLIDIVAVGCELACICCGGLLSAAEEQVQGGEP
ncbi:hypothetical protein WJX79_004964 [Trebouxia sp. C0005]